MVPPPWIGTLSKNVPKRPLEHRNLQNTVQRHLKVSSDFKYFANSLLNVFIHQFIFIFTYSPPHPRGCHKLKYLKLNPIFYKYLFNVFGDSFNFPLQQSEPYLNILDWLHLHFQVSINKVHKSHDFLCLFVSRLLRLTPEILMFVSNCKKKKN